MKAITTLFTGLAVLAFSCSFTGCGRPDHDQAKAEHQEEDDARQEGDAHAGAGEGHADKEAGAHQDHPSKKAGPNGGRLITSVEPHLEFLVTADRKVQITAVDEDNNGVPLGEQTVTVIGGSRTNPTRLAFAKSGKVLLSDTALPEGDEYPLVVTIKTGAGADPVLEKFNLNLSDCPTCDYKEYACICGHDEDE